MRVLVPLLLMVALGACEGEKTDAVGPATTAEPAPALIDQALLADILGEAVEANELLTTADGLLIRLAFEPLIRQTGPISLQLVQSTGYRLLGVAEGAPLWQLGLREGDILMTVDGDAIIGREHELRSLWERRPGSTKIGYQRDGQARTLSLHIRPGSAWRSAAAIPVVAPLVGPSEASAPDPELTPATRCTPAETADSLGRCEIERASLERMLDNPESVARQARIIPAMQDGITRGFKLYGIRAASMPSLLGIQNGDLVVAFDGQPLANLDAAMTAFTRVRSLDSFTLTIERRGETKQLTIAIVDALN
jgi:type II secretory pathway component PulC